MDDWICNKVLGMPQTEYTDEPEQIKLTFNQLKNVYAEKLIMQYEGFNDMLAEGARAKAQKIQAEKEAKKDEIFKQGLQCLQPASEFNEQFKDFF